MKKFTLIITQVLIVFFVGITSAHSKDITLNKFHADIKIYKDANIKVQETIEVDFHLQRRGIYREIPYIFTDDFGKKIKTPIKVISILDEHGNAWKYKTSSHGGIVSIRIGDPNIFVIGRKTYIITYNVDNVIQFFPDRDELYWNVTGNGWDNLIKNVSAKITMIVEDEKAIKEEWTFCYTGSFGSRESKCNYKKLHGESAIEFKSRDLNPNEGFTIAYGWNKGITKEPGAYDKFISKIIENWFFAFPLSSFALMSLLWYFKGRDPKVMESVPVQYQPPTYRGSPITPAEAGALIDERLDMRDITASIIGLAVKGFIKLEEKEIINLEGDDISKKVLGFLSSLNLFYNLDYLLIKTKEPDPSLSEFEQKLMGAIFNSKKSVYVSQLKNNFYKKIPELQNALYKELIKKDYFKNNPDTVRNSYAAMGVILSVSAIFLTIFFYGDFEINALIAGILTGAPLLIFAKFMPAKTNSGSRTLIEIKGFEEFLNKAEKDRLERMKDEKLFEKFLPYAIALDIVDRWASSFEGIYQKPPDWYSSPIGFRVFNASYFTSRLDGALSRMNTSMAAAPRSSGGRASGGGGFSGGGFGGGGGRSW